MKSLPDSRDMYEHAHLAAALAVAALAEPAGPQRKAFLDEARAVHNGLCTECRGTNTVKWVGQWVDEAGR
jgi:hypothetical protein